MNRANLLQKFNEEYQRLNPEQKKAVDHIEGPVMVIAGPGTGKTQILAARIGRILLNTDVGPDNILCLTYTDAGAMAMRKRLLHFIGPDAYRVNIYTFHAFCNDVIQENLSIFEKNNLDPISDLERIELLRELIDQFPRTHPLKKDRGDIYFEIGNLTALFSTMKREGWTPEYILERIEVYINDLPNRKEYIYQRNSPPNRKGDPNRRKIDEEKARMERLSAAVKEFDKFQQMMQEKERYDFDDMINWVIRAFNEKESLLLEYQEKFQYILVDEYQDTSGSQNELVRLLIRYWEQPNIFVVGDDDQSIYRFQGANIENMELFANSYSEQLLTIVLTNNYRSTQNILDVSRALIDNNLERLIRKRPGLSKDLVSSHPEISLLQQQPTILEYESQRQEMTDITLRVEKLIAEGVEPGKIAVLFKENKYGEEMMKLFRFRGLPYYSKRSLNLLSIPFANKILQIIRYVAAEHDTPYGGDQMLFEILHFDFFGIAPMEVAKISVEVADRQFTDQKTSIRRLLYERAKQAPRDLFDTGLPEALARASTILEQLITDAPNVTLQTLLENIIKKSGVLATVMKSPEKMWYMQILTALFDFVKQETRRRPFLTAGEFVETIALMQKNKVPIPLVQVSGTDKGVNLLTAHGSKGLEFEYVFFSGCNASFWEGKGKSRNGFKFPDTIFSASLAAGDDEELRRLFYVAMTRAQKHLYITYAGCMDDGKGLEKSRFIAEILQSVELPHERISVAKEVMFEFNALQFAETAAPEIAKLEEDFITRVLENFVMNVTALNNYLRCPLEFYYKNLIRIPSSKNEALEFGSAIHYAVQRLFEKMKENNETFPSKEEMLQYFKLHMHRHRESFVQQAFNRRLEYGEDVLNNYYDTYIQSWHKVVLLERSIKNVVVNGIPLKGKLDKLEFFGKDVNVVDYKTGDPLKAAPKLKGPDTKQPAGGDYWRQAVFYKILVDNIRQKDWVVISTEFDFIEPDGKKQYQKRKIVISPDDIAFVTKQITSTWAKIQQREFYTGCGSPDCTYCNFVKTNNLQVALHQVEDNEPVEMDEEN